MIPKVTIYSTVCCVLFKNKMDKWRTKTGSRWAVSASLKDLRNGEKNQPKTWHRTWEMYLLSILDKGSSVCMHVCSYEYFSEPIYPFSLQSIKKQNGSRPLHSCVLVQARQIRHWFVSLWTTSVNKTFILKPFKFNHNAFHLAEHVLT